MTSFLVFTAVEPMERPFNYHEMSEVDRLIHDANHGKSDEDIEKHAYKVWLPIEQYSHHFELDGWTHVVTFDGTTHMTAWPADELAREAVFARTQSVEALMIQSMEGIIGALKEIKPRAGYLRKYARGSRNYRKRS